MASGYLIICCPGTSKDEHGHDGLLPPPSDCMGGCTSHHGTIVPFGCPWVLSHRRHAAPRHEHKPGPSIRKAGASYSAHRQGAIQTLLSLCTAIVHCQQTCGLARQQEEASSQGSVLSRYQLSVLSPLPTLENVPGVPVGNCSAVLSFCQPATIVVATTPLSATAPSSDTCRCVPTYLPTLSVPGKKDSETNCGFRSPITQHSTTQYNKLT